jgi:hypothetical protein
MRVGFVVISRRLVGQPDVADMEVGRLRTREADGGENSGRCNRFLRESVAPTR